MESSLPTPSSSFSDHLFSMTSFPPAYLFTVAITSIALVALSGSTPVPLALENVRRRAGNAMHASTDAERIDAERDLRRELKLTLRRHVLGKRSKLIPSHTHVAVTPPAPTKCSTQNPRQETTKRLRKALNSANSTISQNAFAAFRDRLLLSNKIWAQERELRGVTDDKVDSTVPVTDIAKAKPKVEKRDMEVQAVSDEDAETLGVSEGVLSLVQSIADDLTASQREVFALQSQLARYDEEMGQEYEDMTGENERLRDELRDRAGTANNEYSEAGSSEEGDGLEQTMVVEEMHGRPIPLFTHLEGADEDFDDAASIDSRSDSGSDSSTSTIADFDGDFIVDDEDDDYFSSARKMYSLENSKSSPSPTTVFEPMRFPSRPPSPTFSPISSPQSSPVPTPGKLPRRPLANGRRRHHSLHNPNPVFILHPESPPPKLADNRASTYTAPETQVTTPSTKLTVIQRVRKISGSLGAAVKRKKSDASSIGKSKQAPLALPSDARWKL